MLKPAIDYKNKLQQAFVLNIEKTKALQSSHTFYLPQITENTSHSFQWVSVDNNDNIIGYIEYNVYTTTHHITEATSARTFNFCKEQSYEFALDLYDWLAHKIFNEHKCDSFIFSTIKDNESTNSYTPIISAMAEAIGETSNTYIYRITKDRFFAMRH